ncbi:MAG: hypothetical protein H7Y03_15605, partial [Chitinophagaceae bacterium]|nr:hypothetical protein [Chitinophagaceae bacterium]
MNLEDYISSGVVESYVLGLADEMERAEFDNMSMLHPEVKAARIAFEESLHEYALEASVVPPVHIKQTLLDKLSLPVLAEESKVVPITTTTNSGSNDQRV